MKRTLSVALMALLCGGIAAADSIRSSSWPNAYKLMNGSPILRATVVVAAAGTPKDNTSTSGGASVAYTFHGGERVCMQGNAAFCYEIIASGSMTASCAKAVDAAASSTITTDCVTLQASETKISIDGASTAVTVKMFEFR